MAFCLGCFAFWVLRPGFGGAVPAQSATSARAAVARAQEDSAIPEPDASDYERLRARDLLFPLEIADHSALRDTFAEARGDLRHEALDILAPRGTAVVAVEEGLVQKLFTSVRGGLTVYEFDPGSEYCYYYAHLDRYAEGLVEGARVRRGQRLGYVGTSGNAPPNTPHLHFAIFKLGPEKRWWQGTPLNPYALWADAAPR
jgi:murein DD-endopeptidase MepM/ murein hydrolase activator NlpD